MSETQPSRSALEAFLDAYWRDRDEDRVASLRSYLDAYPGDEEAIAREYIRLQEQDSDQALQGTSDLGEATWLGEYRILKELGRGGQGVVYLAQDSRLRRRVALKVLRGVITQGDSAFARFRREAEIASRLDNPGICTIYDAGIVGSTPYIAMRYVEGQTLAQRIRGVALPTAADATVRVAALMETQVEGTPIPAPAGLSWGEPDDGSQPTSRGPQGRDELMELVRVIEQTARALHEAHEVGIIHRDIKPGNVMIGADGEPVIMDFGLARHDEAEAQNLTRSGDVFGTPAYMSPEQLGSPRVEVDRRADVWALGVTLFEAVTQRLPFQGPTREATYQAILLRDPPDPRRLNPGIPADLRTVILTALQKERDRRYATALDLAEDLRRVRSYEPIVATTPSPWVRLLRWAQRNPALAGSLAVAVLALVGGLLTALLLLDRAQGETEAKDRALRQLRRYGAVGLTSAEANLWPRAPETLEAMDQWMARVDTLVESSESEEPEVEALRPLRSKMQAFRDRALSLHQRTVEAHQDAWDACLADIASDPMYGHLSMKPQVGLVPLGRDPSSRCWEFWHVESGARPSFSDARQRFELDADSGLILVLIPGGRIRVSDQSLDDPSQPVVDDLEPFFLSKYEVTQGQWSRVAGSNPSYASPDFVHQPITLLHPVENMTWDEAEVTARMMDLCLPTESRWEFACRAGCGKRWSFGDEEMLMVEHGNVRDLSYKRAYPNEGPVTADYDDGFARHAPVGSFKPNRFGLYDMHGNIFEWCLDGFLGDRDRGIVGRASDGLRGDPQSPYRAYRGGSWNNPASSARSGGRPRQNRDSRGGMAGVRFARSLR